MLLRLIVVIVLTSPAFAQSAQDRPHLFACGPVAFAGQTMCVCGNFPSSSVDGLLLDGKPLGHPLTVSQTSLTFRVPDGAAPGLHVVRGMPEAGYSPSEAVVTTLLELVSEIDQKAMLSGQWTRAKFRVRGTSSPLLLRIVNRTPRIVELEGGEVQSFRTSGGADNTVSRRVHALMRGDFTIDVELTGDACPCAGARALRQARSVPAPPGPPAVTSSEDPRGFLAARILAIVPLASQAALASTAQALAAANGLIVAEITRLASSGDGLIVFTIPGAADVLDRTAALNADPRVRFAEPDFLFDTDGAAESQNGNANSLKYGARLMGMDRLNASLNGKDILVAVIDTGADTKHPVLASRIKFKADVTATPYKAGIHGTLVAGIIADLATRASLFSIQACLPQSAQAIAARCSTVSLAKALDLAIEKHASVINLSIGGPASRVVERMVRQAVHNGAIVVAAGGNGGPNGTPSFPAAMDEVIAVTAVDVERSLYAYATHGSFIDLAAPGVDILSAAPGGQLLFSGTSAAAPHVSAVAALMLQSMLQQKHTLSPAATQELMERTANDLGPAGKDPAFGSGLLNVCNVTRLCR